MKITKKQLRKIIRESLNEVLPASGPPAPPVGKGIGEYYKEKEEARKRVYAELMDAIENYEALPPNSPEKETMKREVERLEQRYYDVGYVGD